MSGQIAFYVQITKSFGPPMVQRWCNGQLETALNWRELAPEAMHAIEPQVRQRWRAYWDSAAAQAAVVRDAPNVNDMTKIIMLPSSHYVCPPEITAKAIWPTLLPDIYPLVEAGS